VERPGGALRARLRIPASRKPRWWLVAMPPLDGG
jgi:hypothetical protein